MSDVEKTVEEPIDPSIIVVRERSGMWVAYLAVVVIGAITTFVIMELLFGGNR